VIRPRSSASHSEAPGARYRPPEDGPLDAVELSLVKALTDLIVAEIRREAMQTREDIVRQRAPADDVTTTTVRALGREDHAQRKR
jgi:hypothetical protein